MLAAMDRSENAIRTTALLVCGLIALLVLFGSSFLDKRDDLPVLTIARQSNDFNISKTIQIAEFTLGDYFEEDIGISPAILNNTLCVLLFPHIEYDNLSGNVVPELGVMSCRAAGENWAFYDMIELVNAKLVTTQSDGIDSLLFLFSDTSVIDEIINGKNLKLTSSKFNAGSIGTMNSRTKDKISSSSLIYYGAIVDEIKRVEIKSMSLNQYQEHALVTTTFAAESTKWHSALQRYFPKGLISKIVILEDGPKI